jgi:O-antigen ligase
VLPAESHASASLLRSPSLAVAVALAAAPLVVLLQSKAMAPLAFVAMALAVLAHRRARGAWPWPRAAAAWLAVALGLWGVESAAWSIVPGRSLDAGAALAGAALLGGAAARAVAEDAAEARARLARWLAAGLALGLAAALFDHLSGNALRAAVRGLREAPPALAFGLKPAAAVAAMLLPLALAAPWPAWARAALAACGAAIVLALPGESPKLAVLAGLAAAGAAWVAPRAVPRLLGAALAALILLGPVVLAPALEAAAPRLAAALPHSAAHRLAIWDFALTRIAERPLLGWGMEASRAIPGGEGGPTEETLARLGLTAPAQRAFLLAPGAAELMPLHPHSGALQVRLELGVPGALLAAALALLLGLAAAHRAPHPPAAAGALAAAAVSALLSFGAWQAWWYAALLLVAAGAAGLPSRAR